MFYTDRLEEAKLGPFTNADGSLVVNDKDKADLMNNFFANIGTKVARTSYHPLQQREFTSCIAPLASNITVTENMNHQKLKAIKINKSAGPDYISSKLLKQAELESETPDSIVDLPEKLSMTGKKPGP